MSKIYYSPIFFNINILKFTFQMFGRTMKSSIAIDNGRSPEFIRKRQYTDKRSCYECGKEGHLSYKCPENCLGERQPPAKKKKKKHLDSKTKERNVRL